MVRTNTFDAAGNLTAAGTRTYTYNSAGRPTSIKQGSTTLTLAYNGQGQRVSKKVGSNTTAFAYDEAGHLIGEYKSTGALIQEVVWLGDLAVASLRAANTLAALDELPSNRRARLN